jgi:hypothetical protein
MGRPLPRSSTSRLVISMYCYLTAANLSISQFLWHSESCSINTFRWQTAFESTTSRLKSSSVYNTACCRPVERLSGRCGRRWTQRQDQPSECRYLISHHYPMGEEELQRIMDGLDKTIDI